MITRPNVTVGTAVSRRPKTQTIERSEIYNFIRYTWSRRPKCKKLREFLYSIINFFGVISHDNHVPVIFAKAETIIKKLGISMRTFRYRLKRAIDEGYFISTTGKERRAIYIAKHPDEKNKTHILKNAIAKCKEHKIFWTIPFLETAVKKTNTTPVAENKILKQEPKTLDSFLDETHPKKSRLEKNVCTPNPKNLRCKSESLHSKTSHSILNTNFNINLGTGTEFESEESPIQHREKTNPTFTQNLKKVFNDSKTKIPNPIIKELVKIWSVYRPAQILEHLKGKIERLNEGTWYPNKIIKMLRDDGLTWHLDDRSRYQSEYFGIHDSASLGLRKSSNYWEDLEVKLAADPLVIIAAGVGFILILITQRIFMITHTDEDGNMDMEMEDTDMDGYGFFRRAFSFLKSQEDELPRYKQYRYAVKRARFIWLPEVAAWELRGPNLYVDAFL